MRWRKDNPVEYRDLNNNPYLACLSGLYWQTESYFMTHGIQRLINEYKLTWCKTSWTIVIEFFKKLSESCKSLNFLSFWSAPTIDETNFCKEKFESVSAYYSFKHWKNFRISKQMLAEKSPVINKSKKFWNLFLCS